MTAIAKSFLLAALTSLSLMVVDGGQVTFEPYDEPEDGRLNFTGLAAKYGHKPLRYEVITEDGYILTLFRIVGASQYPVLLMHGLLDTSDTWLIRGETSLGITLANDGYDVWFGNSRGSRYSRSHVSLDPNKDASYWNWSFDELGYYDLPATIDRILNETGAPSLTAIGHSRGNEIFYILGSTRPEYNSKVNLLIALAPIAFQRNVQPPVSTVLQSLPVLNQFLQRLNIEVTEVFGYNSEATRFLRLFCTLPVIGNELCLNLVIFPVVGYDPEEIEPAFVNVIIYHIPAGTSSKDLLHFSQLRNDFARFDYGKEQNLQVYNSTSAPSYNLTLVTLPVALLAARNDRLSTIPDVETLRSRLPNVVDFTVNGRDLFNHVDYVWGRNMRVYLFPDIYRVLRQYNNVNYNNNV